LSTAVAFAYGRWLSAGSGFARLVLVSAIRGNVSLLT
jgi:hypothetical protein